jgi:hypothetical protein
MGQKAEVAWPHRMPVLPLEVHIVSQTYGEAARRFAIKAWTTPDDSRIERLMGETYGRGYFSLTELHSSSVREALAAQLTGVNVSGNPCAN